ncbi:MAG: hypothetical protein UU81_C0002G0031 [Microgenomates group bacterium GW2011_GWC1_41_8]|nr:MAG: hypothetical protein UU81_C0002G0031 [Microgenomates group bacterium GW2011_GWC1_41_8]
MAEDFTLKKLGAENKEPIVKRKSPGDMMKSYISADIPKLHKSSINKITVSLPKQDTMVTKSNRGKKKPWVKRVMRVALIVLLLFVVLAVAIALPARKIVKEAQDVTRVGTEALEALKMQDLEQTKVKLTETKKELTELQNSYKSLSWTKIIPLVGGYYRDGEHGMNAAQEFITAGDIAVTEITPYADLLGFSEGESSFVDQPADKRIETAIATFDKVTPKIGEISQHLDAGSKELDQINPKRYPKKFQGKEIRSKIEAVQSLSHDTIDLFVNAQPLLEILPELMGMEEEKRYLLLFQNDKELRPTGGFITAYAVLIFDKGKMRVENSSNVYDLDDRQKTNIKAPEEILTYHKGVYYAYLRDSNLSPDFYESMQMFEELLQNVSNPPKYDGIIALDTEVLVATMDVLEGDIFVPEYGENFTTKPDDRCDGCPMVIYELSDYAGRRVGHVRDNRKDVLGKLMFALMQKALGVSPSQYWGSLMQTFFDQINEKHILFYMKDGPTQQALEAVDFAGRIKEYDADYLHINDSNMAGAKSNLFVQHTVTQDIAVENDRTVTKTITIDYKNPSEPSDCNIMNEGLCLNGLLRNWLRIYVPKGSELVSFEGSETEVVTKEDLGKTVFEGFMTVAPKGSSQVVVKYKLPFKADNEYRMLIQKQPGTKGHEYIIKINGREKETFNLTTDKEVRYDL